MTMIDDTDVRAEPDAPAEGANEAAKGKKGKKGKGKEEGGGGRSNLVPAIVLALGLTAGGYFMGGSSTDAGATTETTAEPEVVAGLALSVEPLTVNLAGGHYLRVGVSFQMTDAFEGVVSGEHGDEFAHHDASRVRDMLIALFGGRDAAHLTSAEGRATAKDELLVQANAVLDDQVMEVFLTEFVIQ